MLTKAELKKRRLEHAEKDKERKQTQVAAKKAKSVPGAFVRLNNQHQEESKEASSGDSSNESADEDDEVEAMEVDDEVADEFASDDDEELEFESEDDEDHGDTQEEILTADDMTVCLFKYMFQNVLFTYVGLTGMERTRSPRANPQGVGRKELHATDPNPATNSARCHYGTQGHSGRC